MEQKNEQYMVSVSADVVDLMLNKLIQVVQEGTMLNQQVQSLQYQLAEMEQHSKVDEE